MVIRRKFRDEDIQALVELVQEEVESYRYGRLDSLSTNRDLAKLLSSSLRPIFECSESLSAEVRAYRGKELVALARKKQRENKTGFYGITPERRRQIASLGGNVAGRINYENGTGIFSIDQDSMRLIRQKGGRTQGRRNHQNGTGAFSLDPETRRQVNIKAGRIAGRINYENGVGIHGLSREVRSANSRRAISQCRENESGVFGVDPETGERYFVVGGRIAGTALKAEGKGLFALDVETRRKNSSVGGKTQGKITYETGIGIFALDQETRRQNCQKGGRITGPILGRKNRDEKRGFFAMDPEARSEVSRRVGVKNYEERIGLHAIPPEVQRQNASAGGKIGGRVNYENGTGIFGMDPEVKSEISRRTARKNKERGVGVFGFDVETRRQNGIKSVDDLRKRFYFVESRFHTASQQEGAVALLLEKYVPGYEVAEGDSYQVRGNHLANGGLDFLVNGEFLEWHPIVLHSGRRGDVQNYEDYQKYKEKLASLTDEEKSRFVQSYTVALRQLYHERRQKAVDNSDYEGTPVRLATNVRELYYFISIYNDNMPSFDDFNREFNQRAKYVKGFRVKKPVSDEIAKAA